MSHTLGSWTFNPDDFDVAAEDGSVIAYIAHGDEDREECLRNGILIQAAPDLKSACRAMGDAVVLLLGEPLPREVSDKLIVALDLAGKAIERAGGVS